MLNNNDIRRINIRYPLRGGEGDHIDGDDAKRFKISCVRGKLGKEEEDILKKMCFGSEPRPKMLNIAGGFALEDSVCVAVVGSRKITQYGRDVCEYIAGGLAAAGVTIASGLMYGVGLCAHKAAISAGGRTIAVLGYGFDHLKTLRYARPVADEIISKKCGVVISEYEDFQTPEVWTFPRRNRIVSAFSKAVVIIEASENSGSIITAGFALEQGKEVFVVPGSIFSDVSKGKHKLLKQGAIPVDSPLDILNYLGITSSTNSSSQGNSTAFQTSLPNLSENELTVWEILKNETNPLTLDDLLFETKMSPASLNVAVTSLELLGLAKHDSSNSIQKNSLTIPVHW